MGQRIFTSLIVLIAFAIEPQYAFSQAPNPGQNSSPVNPDSTIRNAPSLSGGLENNQGLLRLNLVNNSSREFRGTGIIGIGGDSEQREIGQLALTLPPNETTLLQISGVPPSGNHFSLRIFDQAGALVFYKIAPIKTVSDSTPAVVVTLSPVSKTRGTTVSMNRSSSPNVAAATSDPGDTSPAIAPASPTVAPEVTIKGRLLAGQSETDPFIIAFEMKARRPINDATMAITMGKLKDRKPVSIRRDLTVEFKLPNQFDSERIGYELTDKSGRVIAKGELELSQLMAEDLVTVTDIRTDKASYDPGESARITLLLEGKSPSGYRLEIQVKDNQGNVIFRDQFQANADNQTNTQGFTLSLTREAVSPITLEFKIFDNETGILFDSGERDIPLNDPKRRP